MRQIDKQLYGEHFWIGYDTSATPMNATKRQRKPISTSEYQQLVRDQQKPQLLYGKKYEYRRGPLSPLLPPGQFSQIDVACLIGTVIAR